MMTFLIAIFATVLWNGTGETATLKSQQTPQTSSTAQDAAKTLLREIRQLSDLLLAGDLSLRARREELLARLTETLLASSRLDTPDPGAIKIAIEVLLLGGDARPLRQMIGKDTTDKRWEAVARAVLAYRDGDRERARELMASLDRAGIPDAILHPLVLMDGVMSAESDPETAVRRFEDVRLAAPGTSLEESALRHQTLVALANPRASDGIAMLAHFARRFPSSPYWEQFLPQAVKAAVRGADRPTEDWTTRSDALTDERARDRFRAFLLEYAHALMLSGKFERAAGIAAHIADRSAEQTENWHRANLVRHVCGASMPSPREARAALEAMDISTYTPDERELIGAAISVANSILEGYIESQDAEAESGGARSKPHVTVPESSMIETAIALTPSVVARARAAIDAADQRLTEDAP
ncbi:MAG: hypothetical protein NW216_11385 [Hyphomicrobium sp.]|nr:hypothetical protein [Hyphomicrobium sp.]